MKKKGRRPYQLRSKIQSHIYDDPDWIIWAAWADRITFEEIEEKDWKDRR